MAEPVPQVRAKALKGKKFLADVTENVGREVI
jgi:hypothetical protein